MAAQHDLRAKVADIENAGGISADDLVKTLIQDEIELFEALFARRTGIDAAAMPVIVYDPGGEPFAIACKASGFAANEFETIYLLLTKALAGQNEADSVEFKRIRAYYKKLDEGAACSVIEEWRQAPAKARNSA